MEAVFRKFLLILQHVNQKNDMKRTKLLTMVAVLVMLFSAAREDKTTTVFIIGDSTAANKDISGGK